MKDKLNEIIKRIEKLEHANKYKECPHCYGKGFVEDPSKELDMSCDTCYGEGEVRR